MTLLVVIMIIYTDQSVHAYGGIALIDYTVWMDFTPTACLRGHYPHDRTKPIKVIQLQFAMCIWTCTLQYDLVSYDLMAYY